MTWAIERRLDYIEFRLATAGSVQRADLMRTFGISTPQASEDIAAFLLAHPGRMEYDRRAKRYVAAAGSPGVRGMTARVTGLLSALAAEGHPIGWR